MGNSPKKPRRGIKTSKGIPERSYLQIQCYDTDSYMQYLYDFKDKAPKKQQIAITTSGIAIKEEEEPFTIYPISYLSKQLNNLLPCGIKFITHRIAQKKGFYIEPIKIVINGGELEKAIWKVVKYLPEGKHVCREGDIFRLGWQKFKIKELVFKLSERPTKKGSLKTKHTLYQNLTKSHKKSKQDKHGLDMSSVAACRICLEEGTIFDPLIPPCECQGSMRYIHISCLQDWLDKKLQYFNFRGAILINWKPLTCQLCRTSYMHQIYLDGKKHYTLNFPVPERPYVVIEILEQGESNKVYELISFATNSRQLVGRGEEADIYLPGCPSVSRIHSRFIFNPITNQFIIEDADSRYGTLVLQSKSFKIDETHPTAFQVGVTLFKINMVKGQDELLNKEISKQNCDQQFKNLIVYDDSDDEKPQIQQYKLKIEEDDDIEDFTKPLRMLGLNVRSIQPFQTNVNESKMQDSEGEEMKDIQNARFRDLPTGNRSRRWQEDQD